MDKLKENLSKLWVRFKTFNKGIRIAIIAAIITFIIAVGSLFFYNSATKYKVLFSSLEATDAQVVITKLNEKKVDMKIEGDTILVPKDQVDQLRLELAPELTDGSSGYELMDSGSSFGMTDEEFKLKKLRMQQGELEKTIKFFPQVETARVHITPSKDSVFVEDKEPGKAAVYLKLVAGNELNKEQVKSIVALVSRSTENVPEENIEVVDDKMNLLTEGLFEENSSVVSSDAIEQQLSLKKKYEEELQKSIVALLEPVVGRDKVESSVNVDLDFDSKQKTETIVDPNKVIVSQQVTKETNGSNDGENSGSPVDNNMGNTIDDETSNNTSYREEVNTNYEVGKTETTTISAPGEVKRLTASVFVDGNIDGNVQAAIEKSVANAIGINTERGDSISVVGMTFDPITKEEAQNEFDAINEDLAKESRNKIILYSVLGLIGIILVIVILIIIRRKNKNEEEAKNLLDVVIDDRTAKEEAVEMPSINFESINPKAHIENEIKKYASDKPDQVVDIIKSWLVENER
ncbi:flagellar basal-body MS-ring/collar protein FliF [Clostridium sp. AL.422]|uniref:flagellar basal-body MS-ring/collar protein FliF n=1 Tax=Clostridium TaxID=1485 RepID=UPI00293DBC14|nr:MULTISPECIES: flagellar basal-body MS-ring/collar protein FliF [unclassified Clostridium]MDV4149706.1 flagellar basal-body MS-ring/collar protein FliF [Clostridium sp. AL.422]